MSTTNAEQSFLFAHGNVSNINKHIGEGAMHRDALTNHHIPIEMKRKHIHDMMEDPKTQYLGGLDYIKGFEDHDFQKIIDHPRFGKDGETLERIAKNPELKGVPLESMVNIASGKDGRLSSAHSSRAYVARILPKNNPHLTLDHIKEITTGYPDHRIFDDLAKTSANPDVLRHVHEASQKDDFVANSLVKNPHTPDDVIDKMTENPKSKSHRNVAFSKTKNPDIIGAAIKDYAEDSHLHEDGNGRIQHEDFQMLHKNPHLTHSHVDRLIDYATKFTRWSNDDMHRLIDNEGVLSNDHLKRIASIPYDTYTEEMFGDVPDWLLKNRANKILDKRLNTK